MAYVISDACISCGSCADACPVGAISQGADHYEINAGSCLDCGSCGAPSCRALAEDIVRGNSRELDCVFRLKERVRTLAQQMIELSDGNF